MISTKYLFTVPYAIITRKHFLELSAIIEGMQETKKPISAVTQFLSEEIFRSKRKIFNRKDIKTFCEFIHPPAEDISQLPTEIPRLLTNPTLDAYKSLAPAPTTGGDWDKNDNHFGQF